MIDVNPIKQMPNRRALIVYNPQSGRHKAKKYLNFYQKALKGHYELIEVSGISAAETSVALRDSLRNANLVIAIGGDGLVNLVIQELADSKVPLFVHAAGTGNDFHRQNYRKMIRKHSDIVKLADFRTRQIDLVLVEFADEQRYFGQILSAGFDSVVNRKANELKYLPGTLKYVLALILEIFSFEAFTYRISVDGVTREIDAMMIVVANGPTYGGGMKVVPQAQEDDGELDILILHPVSKLELLRVFPKVYFGNHIKHPRIEILKGQEIEITSNAPIYADGEYFGVGTFKALIKTQLLDVVVI